MKSASRVERGDWQTPLDLARQVSHLAARLGARPASILEPTCGRGAFLQAAAEVFPGTFARGFDINVEHVERARLALAGRPAAIDVGDCFDVPWEDVLAKMPEPLLVLGNPPWVTSAELGARGSRNLPPKSNFKRFSGLDAMTGKSNFDVSEWILLRLLAALRGRDFRVAVLCKSSVARRVMEHVAREGTPYAGATYRIDARGAFDVAAAAVVMTLATRAPGEAPPRGWAVFDSLDAERPERTMGVHGGRLYSDIERFERTKALEGDCTPAWRSGLKHDCAPVMELEAKGGALVNGLGERVDIEDLVVFPLLKGSDVANGRRPGRRFVLVTQRWLGEETRTLREQAPRAWAYLVRHEEKLDVRKSSIYRDKPPFSVFGIGPYTFAPYKVAICGLYKKLAFSLVEPHEGRPVVLDDTCYFLPFEAREQAEAALLALQSEAARVFFEARVFWEDKRPIGKGLLQSISLAALGGARG
ncbi:class I SAM-dependent methyltransferase [Polyangium spumosum]|uniref:SAM-dependent DNA methyltransferase n=1 Tax=Polyangium spumosum TaxID=889282 RepID=A0A6N7PNZ1_9BACT|nr:class I SAM-dependent methyltransferase [Polyangium spumosum]MRG91844.1 SAM-dependent DNA methyltransferase [Polyangium spumosum]